MAIVSGNCCVSLKCIITPPTSFDPSIYMGTHVETQMYTLTHTYIHADRHLQAAALQVAMVVMVFCSTPRCNGPRHRSVGAISLL